MHHSQLPKDFESLKRAMEARSICVLLSSENIAQPRSFASITIDASYKALTQEAGDEDRTSTNPGTA